jgi:tRNA-Thr(GGU) m(6)t(6)A37 methyltransferase TsaA
LEGIKGFSHAVIVCYLHQAEFESAKHLIRRPQGREGMPMTGIFAQRAKDRPNHIGITAVEILDACDCTLTVRGLDAIDGTPVLDIKPYFPAFDCRHEATVPEWVDVLMEHYF